MSRNAGQRTAQAAEQMSPRLGPRPLPLALTTAMLTWTGSRLASANLKSGSPPWSRELADSAAALENRIREFVARADGAAAGETEAGDDEAAWRRFLSAVDAAIVERANELIAGILAYRRHPYRRDVAAAPVAWRAGGSALLDYGAARREAPPLLVVPSLINRYYVLDLKPGRSLLRYLEGRGFRPFVIDWGRPGEAESRYGLTDYVAGRLEGALDAVRAITGRAPAIVGYCMGGLLALALAQRRQDDVAGLALLATPWDFAADAPPVVGLLPALRPALSALIAAGGTLPTDVIQALFYSLDPMLVIRKFLKFGHLAQDGAAAEDFVALEDWLNDGVPLAGPVAEETLLGWYCENAPRRLRWRIAGRTVDPSGVTVPSLVMIPSRDRIVPPASAEALASALPAARVLRVPLGHIGMAASASARERAWAPLAEWLEEIAPA